MEDVNETPKDGASSGVVLERIVSQLCAHVPAKQNKGATVRFTNGMPCCTCTYNYNMTVRDQQYLARRIAASLNFTKNISLEELESKTG
jgi:hypothetical protein